MSPEAFPVHTVQFYNPPFFPARSIADYFCAGIEAEESSLILATADHTRMIKECMEACGVETDTLESAGLLTCIDAESTLTSLQKENAWRERTLDSVLGRSLMRATRFSPQGRLRAYGELVNFLARNGEHDKCADLERVWNRLIETYSFRVYCTYSLASFSDESSADAMCAVCDLHDEIAVVTPEVHLQGWTTLLLQRSRSRQAEVQVRKSAERTLHYWEAEYARLFDAHVAHWRDCIQQSLLTPAEHLPPSAAKLPNFDEDLGPTVERALEQIVVACGEACAARKSLPADSVAWHKSTGEILAYGKLTNVLDKLQKLIRTRKCQ
jgi:hypothetical protein